MTRKQKRFLGIGSIGLVLALAATLVAIALRDEIVFFYFPSEVVVGQKVSPGQRFRLGGLVEKGSILYDGTKVSFAISDGENVVPVVFIGLLPDLFREEQGVIAEGTLQPDGRFLADNVLAKHDENYMPRELADMLKQREVWQGGGGAQ